MGVSKTNFQKIESAPLQLELSWKMLLSFSIAFQSHYKGPASPTSQKGICRIELTAENEAED